MLFRILTEDLLDINLSKKSPVPGCSFGDNPENTPCTVRPKLLKVSVLIWFILCVVFLSQ